MFFRHPLILSMLYTILPKNEEVTDLQSSEASAPFLHREPIIYILPPGKDANICM